MVLVQETKVYAFRVEVPYTSSFKRRSHKTNNNKAVHLLCLPYGRRQ